MGRAHHPGFPGPIRAAARIYATDETGGPSMGKRHRHQRQRIPDRPGPAYHSWASWAASTFRAATSSGCRPKDFGPSPPSRTEGATGEQFLPPEKKSPDLTGGKFPFRAQLPSPHLLEVPGHGGAPYRVRGLWIVGSNPAGHGHPGGLTGKGIEGPSGIYGGVRPLHDAHGSTGRPGAARRSLAGAGRRGLHAQNLVRVWPAKSWHKSARPGTTGT
jgi:hypothetical protein